MPTIKPIETRYAGCRFRSRLEARWAVFFDTLGVKWEYEAQGFEVHDRLGICTEKSWYYLPDFWLPGLGLHAEVKGVLDESSMCKLLSAAAYLSSPSGGCGGGNDMLILGPIPKPHNTSTDYLSIDNWIHDNETVQMPIRLHMHKGDLQFSGFHNRKFRCEHRGYVANDTDGLIFTPSSDFLLSGFPNKHPHTVSVIKNAYAAALSARFEYGEQG